MYKLSLLLLTSISNGFANLTAIMAHDVQVAGKVYKTTVTVLLTKELKGFKHAPGS
jgi:hypothetical protein